LFASCAGGDADEECIALHVSQGNATQRGDKNLKTSSWENSGKVSHINLSCHGRQQHQNAKQQSRFCNIGASGDAANG